MPRVKIGKEHSITLQCTCTCKLELHVLTYQSIDQYSYLHAYHSNQNHIDSDMPASSTTPITSALLAALQEAFAVASSHVPALLRAQFGLIGSGAMLYHGYRRRSQHLDSVGTTTAHGAFLDGARSDARFSVMTDGGRVYMILVLHSLFTVRLNCIAY